MNFANYYYTSKNIFFSKCQALKYFPSHIQAIGLKIVDVPEVFLWLQLQYGTAISP